MGQVFTNKLMNNNSITDVKEIELNQDADHATKAVRKSQAETIAATAVQAQLISSAAQALATNTYNANFIQAALDGKQGNLSVDSNYFTLVNNTLGFKDLGIVKPHKDTTHTTMAEFINAATFNGDGTLTINGIILDTMSMIFLQSATNPSEKSFVYLGTNNGNAGDFATFSVDYNDGTIRSFFSGSGIGISYTAGTGVFSLNLGTTVSQLGGQTIPVDAAEFTEVTGNTVLAILKAIESALLTKDAAQTTVTSGITSRITALVGSSASNMGTFTQGLFSSNQSVKQLLQASETLHKSSLTDRGAIRTEFAAADAALQSNIDSEANTRSSATTTLQANIDSEANARNLGDATLTNNLAAEAIARAAADGELDARLDTIEGSGAGSVAKAEADAGSYTDAREQIIMSYVNANAADITKLTDSNIHLVATIDSNGKFIAVETDSRNNSDFTSVAMVAGEVVVFDGLITLFSNDFKTNDKLMAKTDIASGTMALNKFVYTKADDTDVTKANIGSSTIELDTSDNLAITDNSVGRTQLDAAIETDIDDKFSKTSHSQVITGKSISIDQTDTNTGSSYGLYLKKTQTGSGALTGTSRALLVENWINSNGSGNPAAPSYAHNSLTTHYNGNCTDLSLVISGSYSEANAKAGTAINAIGSYAVSTDTQLGVNIGLFGAAENAAVSNVSVLGYASTNGAGADRGIVGAVTSQSIALYAATRAADPFPFDDIAVVADAKYAPTGSKAFYACGDVVLEGGTVSVPSATADGHAVNRSDLKGKQDIISFDLSSGSKTITTSLDVSKIPPIGDGNIEHGVSGVTVAASKDAANSQITFTATGSNVSSLTSVTVYLQEFICSVRNV